MPRPTSRTAARAAIVPLRTSRAMSSRSCVVYSFARSAQRGEKLLFWGLGMVLGGAVGNLVDRIRFRAVVDFLDFYVGQWHWPAFNVADIAICCGALLVCLSMWLKGPSGRAS